MVTNKTVYEVPSWSQIYTLLLKQAEHIRREGFNLDLIVGVARGGWLPARFLSDLLENSNLASVQVKSYVGIGELHKPVILQNVSASVDGRRVLVVDDVTDSGGSLKLVKELLLERGALEVKTATLYFKPKSVFKPDFYSKRTSRWIIFPWDVKETLRKLFEANKHDSEKLNHETDKIVAAGVPNY